MRAAEGGSLSEPLQVGQFAIVAHEPHERGAAIGIALGNGAGPERCELFAVAEGTTPAANEFAGHLISQAERTWKLLNLSLTGALIAIYSEFQHSVKEWNTRSLSQHRVGLGLACFARQGDRVVLATRGPASILHASGPMVSLFEPDEEHGEPMDGLEFGQPQLTSVMFKPGDRVLLMTTNITAAFSDEELRAVLRLSLPEILPNLYRRITHLRDASALLIELPEEGAEVLFPPPPAAEESPAADAPDAIATEDADAGPVIGGAAGAASASADFQPSLFVESGPEATSLEEARKRLEEADAGSRVEADAQEVTQLAQQEELPPLQRAVGDEVGGVGFRAPASGAGGSAMLEAARLRQPPIPPVGSHQTSATPVSQLAADRRSQLAATTRVPTSGRLVSPSAGARGSVVSVRRAMGGGGRAGRGSSPRTASFLPPTWLIALLGAIALVAIIAWAALPPFFEEGQDARLAGLLGEAESALASAAAEDHAGLRREALTRAQGLLLEAQLLEGGQALAAPLLRQAERELARLDAIVTPAAVVAIADLRGFSDAPIVARQLVVGDAHAYVLDAAGQRVISINLTTGRKAVVYPREGEGDGAGVGAGADANEAAPAPVAITYAGVARPDGSALLIADATGALWAANPAGWTSPIEFARPEGLTITDIYFSADALYVLDAPAATVYRFSAGATGFEVEPLAVLEDAELVKARRLMIAGEDVFTADADGVIRRYRGEFTLTLAQAGIDTPLAAAATPHPIGLEGEVAVLDASADRIVILGREGVFVRQYRHADLQQLTAFTMAGGYGYVISGEHLRRITY